MKRTYSRLGVAAIAVGSGLWVRAADPGWARAAGLDVWNVGRLEAVVEDQEAFSGRLETSYDAAWHRARVNEGLTRDVADGRLSLAAAAALLWNTNRDVPGFATSLDVRFQSPTPVAACARLLLLRVERDEGVSAVDRALALARLRAEYAVEFGHPAPGTPAVLAT